MPIIEYDYKDFEANRRSRLTAIRNYYNQRKATLNQRTMQDSQNTQIKLLHQQLKNINAAFDLLTPEQIQTVLNSSINTQISEQLEIIAKNISGSLQKKFNLEQIKTTRKAIIDLNSLIQTIGQKQSIDLTKWNTHYLKIEGALKSAIRSGKGLKEIGNMLGYVGAVAGQIAVSDLANGLIEQLNSVKNTNLSVSVYNTGDTNIKRKKLLTDIMALFSEAGWIATSADGKNIKASLNASAKFNTSYIKDSQKSTKTVKISTRNVKTFLSTLSNNQKKDYEYLLYNYLSFHKNNMRKSEKDWIWKRYTYEDPTWNEIKRGVAIEMIYDSLNRQSPFMFNGEQYLDRIHFYTYGNKIVLENNFTNNLFLKTGDVRLAQINAINAQRKLIANEKAKGRAYLYGGFVQVDNEAEAEAIIAKTSIIYNQSISL